MQIAHGTGPRSETERAKDIAPNLDGEPLCTRHGARRSRRLADYPRWLSRRGKIRCPRLVGGRLSARRAFFELLRFFRTHCHRDPSAFLLPAWRRERYSFGQACPEIRSTVKCSRLLFLRSARGESYCYRETVVSCLHFSKTNDFRARLDVSNPASSELLQLNMFSQQKISGQKQGKT